MAWSKVIAVVFANIGRNKRHFILSTVGLVVGVATFTFFLALGSGIREGVLNRIYPVNQIELEPASVGVVGLQQQLIDEDRLDRAMVETFRGLDGVTAVFPKLRSRMQAKLWGGRALLGYDAKAEAFFDGVSPELVREELQRNEGVDGKRRRAAERTPEPCLADAECALGQECVKEADASAEAPGSCQRIEYWKRFEPSGQMVPCDATRRHDACVAEEACVGGFCRTRCGEGDACGDGETCVVAEGCEGASCGYCAPACGVDGDCDVTDVCVPLERESGGGTAQVCERLRCELPRRESQIAEAPNAIAGEVQGRCANGVSADSPACEPMACPPATYCAAWNPTTTEGVCERPLPVLLSPFLVEMFNSSVATSLGMQRIDGLDALLGVRFRLQLGNSMLTADLPLEQQAIKLAEIVGFSNKALDLGATLPLDDVRRMNARVKGRVASERFDTFLLETGGNEDVSGLIAESEARGFALSRKSQDARKAADLLFILTVVFSFISLVILSVAAVNILHTFLMLVTERRHEIGILRAVGATRGDVRRLVLLEAGLVGLVGGVIGELVSFCASAGVNALAAEYLRDIPFKPDDFFVYEPGALAFGLGFAILFCLLGAAGPAGRAARLDPAVVLTS